jgi:uncharacterized protein (DUF433 family)
VDRAVELMRERLGADLVSVWLYGARARRDAPAPMRARRTQVHYSGTQVSPRAQRKGATRQRSFRLRERTLDLLDARAREAGQAGNSLAQRVLDEGLRTDRHPLIHFREGGSGDRRPALVGTRLYVLQVIETLRASEQSREEAVDYLGLTPAQVQACVSYYAEFSDEVDAHADEEREFARREEERWRRERAVAG